MALTDSIAAYEDCFQAFERAAKSKKGIRILFEDKKTANYFRLRMNYARVLQRREAVRMYDRTDPRWDVTNEKKKEVLAAFEEAFELKAGSLTKIDTFWDRKFNVVEGYAGDKLIFSYPSRPRVR